MSRSEESKLRVIQQLLAAKAFGLRDASLAQLADKFNDALVALAKAAPSALPVGWKLVPVEPTEEMVAAAVTALGLPWREIQRMLQTYRAMLSASALPVGWNDLARDIGGVANLLEHRMTTEGNMERENTRLAVETLRRAQAMLSASPPEPVSGWRDIATAPRDRSIFLGAVDGVVRFVSWGKTSHVPIYGFCLADQGAEDYDLCEPSCWQPLPSPPSEPGVK
jgi:hypothetical protein